MLNKVPYVHDAFEMLAAARYGESMQAPPFIVTVPSDRYFVDDHCANCLESLPEDVDGLFCSTWCNEIATAVRYHRGVFRDERATDADVIHAIGIRNAFLLAGGYRALGRTLPQTVRLAVKTRDGGKCQVCGKSGTDIDHIDGSSAKLNNLQLLCAKCHNAKTDENLVPASDEERAWIIALQVSRVAPEVPRLLADDQEEWRHIWGGLTTARRQRLLDELTAAGVKTEGLKTRADMIVARYKAASSRPQPSCEIPEDEPTMIVNWEPRNARPQARLHRQKRDTDNQN